MTRYFVMLHSAMGTPLPLVDLEDDPVLFDSFAQAKHAAERNIIGESFGYRVYDWESERLEEKAKE